MVFVQNVKNVQRKRGNEMEMYVAALVVLLGAMCVSLIIVWLFMRW